MDKPDHLANVRKQYEDYPYPERNPLDETRRLRAQYLDCLDRINHYCHSGKKDFTSGARILIAGGGTGDSTIFLAEQLRGLNSEIVYLDFSSASMEIARQRAEIRGLENIIWICDSLLNIPALNLGKFDHISCSGVLHHLDDPDEGLHALESVLDDNGAMTLMVYGTYGRTAVYQVQELMHLINPDESDMYAKIHNCRTVLKSLPPKHWYQLTRHREKDLPDIELYDVFLHSQDRSYTIAQLYDFIESAGMQLVQLFDQAEKAGNTLYDPASYIIDEKLLALVRSYDHRKQQAIAELLNGQIWKHSFYAARILSQPPVPGMLDYIPSLPLLMARGSYDHLYHLVSTAGDYVTVTTQPARTSLRFRKTSNMESFFKYLDGEKTLKQIYDLIIHTGLSTGSKDNYGSLGREFEEMYAIMFSHNQLYLRHVTVPSYKTADEMQARMKSGGSR